VCSERYSSDCGLDRIFPDSESWWIALHIPQQRPTHPNTLPVSKRPCHRHVPQRVGTVLRGGRIRSLHVGRIRSQVILVYYSDLACCSWDTRFVSGRVLHLSSGQTVLYTSHFGGFWTHILLGKSRAGSCYMNLIKHRHLFVS